LLNDYFLHAYFCSQFCRPGTLDPSKVNGKIVLCVREGKIKSVSEGQEALSAGAKGVIMKNQPQISGNTLLSEPHVLSTININYRKDKTDATGHSIEIIPT
jgi:hypothetical protein